jgi:hypothetical protein
MAAIIRVEEWLRKVGVLFPPIRVRAWAICTLIILKGPRKALIFSLLMRAGIGA